MTISMTASSSARLFVSAFAFVAFGSLLAPAAFAKEAPKEGTKKEEAKSESKTVTKTETKTAEKTNSEVDSKKESGDKKVSANPVVIMETSLGNVEIELNAEKAPISVENFLKYVNDGFYTNTIFHRVISTFMIQGGGFDEKMSQKTTRAQIKNEAANGLKNDKGTVAMARTNVVDSATAQFFINVKDNDFLNHSGPNNYGYAVFGKVISGMDIVEKIKAVPTTFKGGMEDVPVTPVVIKSIKKK
jgi:peptidyl-prolyl cis-trans isomerase A (cyclophilin A)